MARLKTAPISGRSTTVVASMLSFPESPIPQQARSERDGSFAVLATSGRRNFCRAAIQKDLIPTHEEAAERSVKDHCSGEQGPNHINWETRVSPNQRLHTHPRIRLEALQAPVSLAPAQRGKVGPEVWRNFKFWMYNG